MTVSFSEEVVTKKAELEHKKFPGNAKSPIFGSAQKD